MTTATSPKKLYRKIDPSTSRAAAHGVDTKHLKSLVLNAIKQSGKAGMTGKELAQRFSEYPYSSITSRPNELESDGLIVATDMTRERSRVWLAKEFA